MVHPTIVKIFEAADQLSAQLNKNRELFERVVEKAQKVKDSQEPRQSPRVNEPPPNLFSQTQMPLQIQPQSQNPNPNNQIPSLSKPAVKTSSETTTSSIPNLPNSQSAISTQENLKEVLTKLEPLSEQPTQTNQKHPETNNQQPHQNETTAVLTNGKAGDSDQEVIPKIKVNPAEPIDLSKEIDEAVRKKMDELAQENLELVEAVREYQEALDLIMGKHRVLMAKLNSEREAVYQESQSELIQEKSKNEELMYENWQLRNQLAEMLQVIRTAADVDDDQIEKENLILMESLQKENENLRQLLGISSIQN